MPEQTRNLHIGSLPFLQYAAKLPPSRFVQFNGLRRLLQCGAVGLGFGRIPACRRAGARLCLLHLQPAGRGTVGMGEGKAALLQRSYLLLCGTGTYEV